MLWFTSRREKRLWCWAFVAVAAIYATLGVAQALADELRDQGLLGIGFTVGMLLIAVSILTQGLKVRPRGLEIGIALGIVGVYLLAFLRVFSPEHRSHLLEYSIVALLVHQALSERKGRSGSPRAPGLLAIAITMLVGVADECIQWFLPNRVFDLFDLLFDLIAIVMAVTANGVLVWVRGRIRSRRGEPG